MITRRRIVCLVLLISLGIAGCSLLTQRASGAFEVNASVAYAAQGQVSLMADLYKPAGQGPFPAVVVIHGGGWVGGQRADMRREAQRLARHGLIVLNIDYRSARQYAHPAQLEDCREAVRWLRRNAADLNLDVYKIAALGYSAGGHLALMLGVTRPAEEAVSSRVHAVVSGAGPTNLLEYPDRGLVKRLMGNQRITGRGHLWADASPITHVSAEDPPVFFYHGFWDMVVPLRHSRTMARALEQARVHSEIHVQPFGHSLTHVFSALAINEAAAFIKAMPALPADGI